MNNKNKCWHHASYNLYILTVVAHALKRCNHRKALSQKNFKILVEYNLLPMERRYIPAPIRAPAGAHDRRPAAREGMAVGHGRGWGLWARLLSHGLRTGKCGASCGCSMVWKFCRFTFSVFLFRRRIEV